MVSDGSAGDRRGTRFVQSEDVLSSLHSRNSWKPILHVDEPSHRERISESADWEQARTAWAPVAFINNTSPSQRLSNFLEEGRVDDLIQHCFLFSLSSFSRVILSQHQICNGSFFGYNFSKKSLGSRFIHERTERKKVHVYRTVRHLLEMQHLTVLSLERMKKNDPPLCFPPNEPLS